MSKVRIGKRQFALHYPQEAFPRRIQGTALGTKTAVKALHNRCCRSQRRRSPLKRAERSALSHATTAPPFGGGKVGAHIGKIPTPSFGAWFPYTTDRDVKMPPTKIRRAGGRTPGTVPLSCCPVRPPTLQDPTRREDHFPEGPERLRRLGRRAGAACPAAPLQ